MKTRNDIIVALLAVMLTGCTANSVEGPTPGARCVADGECPTSLVCRYDVCVTEDLPARTLAFRLVPPNSTTWKPQWVSASEIDADEPLNIALIPSVEVAGKLLYVNDANQIRPDGPSGVLTFRREGQRDALEQYRVESDSRYATYLLPGRYSIVFVPDDTAAPPVSFGTREFTLDTDPELTVPARSVSVTGSLRDALAPGIRATAVARANVVAVSSTTGTASSVGTTDEDGFFTLNVLPQPERYDLRLSYETETYLREVTIRDALDCTESKCTNLLADDDTFQVSLEGVIGTSNVSKVRVQTSTELIPDFTGVVVELRGEFAWGTTRIRRQLQASGEFDVRLPEGSYTTVVSVPREFPFSGVTKTLETSPNQDVLAVDLRPKVSASATIVGLDDRLVDGAVVEFRKSEESDPIVVTSDENGEVQVLLEAVPHRVVVSSNQSGVARGVYTWDPNQPKARLELPPAAILVGNVLGSPQTDDAKEWAPVENVLVQVVEQIDSENVTVGEATTRADGEFRVLIPAPRR